MTKKILLSILAFFAIFIAAAALVNAADPSTSDASASDVKVVIYENAACGHCKMYLMNLIVFLEQQGIKSIEEKNIVNDIEARKELDEFNKKFNIPIELQAHIVTVINENLVLGGHVPIDMVSDYFKKHPDFSFPKLLVYQDIMAEKEDLQSYTIMDANGNIKELSINDLIVDAVDSSNSKKKVWWESSLLFIVLTTGLVAGIHPCTIAVLLFFIAFLFTIHRTRANVFKVGASYILGIFLAYLLIGVGLLKAVTFANSPHFAAQVAAILVILLGIFNLLKYFLNGKQLGKWASLGIPQASKETIVKLIHKSSVPAAFILGILVGVCSFGCTAGIYFGILGLLLNEATKGFLYLLLYNLMFIVPLIVILIFASNKKVVEKMEKFEVSEKKYIKLIAGIIMILLGLFILYGGILH